MGLREALRDMMDLQDITGGFNQATANYRQQQEQRAAKEDLRSLAQQLPGALESGDINSLAGEAYKLGDKSILESALKQNEARLKTKPVQNPFTVDELMTTFGVSPQQAAIIATSPDRDEQRQMVTTINSGENAKATRAQARTAEERRQDENLEKSRVAFSEKFTKTMEPLRKELKTLDELSVMDLGNTTQFWLAATKALKGIGGESGQLTDRDLGRPFPPTAGKTIKDLANWMELRDPNKVSIDPSIVASLQGVIKALGDKRKTKIAERAANEIKREATSRRNKLLDPESKSIDPVIEEAAREFGIVAGFDDKGKFTAGKEIPSTKTRMDPDLAKANQDAIVLVKGIPPQYQDAAVKKIQAYSAAGKPVNPAFLAKLKKMGAQ